MKKQVIKSNYLDKLKTNERERVLFESIYFCIESFNDMNRELKSHFRQKNEQENIHQLINEDDENSLTFHILNQQENLFEKQLFKSRRFH